MSSEPKPPIQIAAEQLLAAGGVRHEAGSTVVLPSGTRVEVLSGWAAVRDSRILCVGRLGPPSPPSVLPDRVVDGPDHGGGAHP